MIGLYEPTCWAHYRGRQQANVTVYGGNYDSTSAKRDRKDQLIAQAKRQEEMLAKE